MKYLSKECIREQLEDAFRKGTIRLGFKQNETKYLQFSEVPSAGIMKVMHSDEKYTITWMDVELL